MTGGGGGATTASGTYGTGFGGNGGGLVSFDVTGTTTINGSITANGQGGFDAAGGAGGGGGGTIYIQTGTFAGSGSLSALGGYGGTPQQTSTSYGGGGGGGAGRIGIFFNSSTWTGTTTVTGGTASIGNGANNDGVDGSAGFVSGLTAAAVASLAWLTTPSHSSFPIPAGTVFSTQPHLIALDASGYRTNFSNSTTITLTPNATSYDVDLDTWDCDCGVSQSSTFTGNPILPTQGKAAFTSFAITTPTDVGGICISASAGGLSTGCVGRYTVTTGAASKLAFKTQPSTTAVLNTNFAIQPQVYVQDAYSNTITTSSAAVSLAPYANNTCGTSAGGVLSGGSATASSGIAVFSGVKYDTNATIYLQASSPGLTSACSNSVVVGTGSTGSNSDVYMIFRGY